MFNPKSSAHSSLALKGLDVCFGLYPQIRPHFSDQHFRVPNLLMIAGIAFCAWTVNT